MFDVETPFDQLPTDPVDQVPVTDSLVADLDWLPAGIMLASALSRIDRGSLSGHDRVSVLKVRSKLIAHLQAELLADIQAVSESVSELANHAAPDVRLVFDTTAKEVSVALSLTRGSSEVMTGLGDRLCRRLPQVWQALSEGLIDLARARVLSEQTNHLPQALARQVCDQVLTHVSSQTTGQLRGPDPTVDHHGRPGRSQRPV
jgi:putative component of toxin-antitoxin plasmid stabilization module